jgi:DNA-binding transcriptional MocR family regulator
LSIPTALSLCTILDDATFLSSLLQKRRSRLERHYAICTQFLKKLGIQYQPASAGTAIWVDLSPYVAQQPGDTRNDQRRSLQDSFLRGGVHVSRAGNLQEKDESAYFKICFAMDRGALMIGLKRFVSIIALLIKAKGLPKPSI